MFHSPKKEIWNALVAQLVRGLSSAQLMIQGSWDGPCVGLPESLLLPVPLLLPCLWCLSLSVKQIDKI